MTQPLKQLPGPTNVVQLHTKQIEQVPTHDSDVERAVLAAMFMEPIAWRYAIENLVTTDFYVPKYENVFADLLTMPPCNELAARIEVEKRGGDIRDVLDELMYKAYETCQPPDIEKYCVRLRGLAKHRHAVKIAAKILQAVVIPGNSIDEILGTASADIAALEDSGGATEETLDSRVQANLDGSRYALGHEAWPCLASTLVFLPGTTTMLCAHTGKKKTFWITKLIVDLFRQGKRISLLALEMGLTGNLERIVAQQAGDMGILNPAWCRENAERYKNIMYQWREFKNQMAKEVVTAPKASRIMDWKEVLRFIQFAADKGKELIVIDPVTRIHMDDVAKDGTKFVHQLVNIIEKYQTRCVLVTHPRTGCKGVHEDHMSGCAAYRQNTSATLWLENCPDTERTEPNSLFPGERRSTGIYNQLVHLLKVRGPQGTGKIGNYFNPKTLMHSEIGFVE